MSPPAERVYTMTDYFDGPRGGIADYCGHPHLYRSLWAESREDGSDVFELIPIDRQTFELALENWEIWRRWEAAFHRGETSPDMHPALPCDRQRHEALAALLEPRLSIRPNNAVTATAEFDSSSTRGPGLGAPVAVRWTVVDRPVDCIPADDNKSR